MSKISKLLLAAGFALTASTAANAASDSSAVQQTVRALFAKANKGDFPGALKLCTDDGALIDEFAPFGWSSFGSWGDALGNYDAQNGVTDAKTTILKFRHVNVDGGNAYVVASVVYSYKEDKKARKEPGTEVFTLQKGADGWRLHTFAWFSKDGVDDGADATAVIAAVKDFAAEKSNPNGPPTAIADEFAPYSWLGADAASGWLAGLQKSMAADHDSDLSISLAAPSHLSVNGDRAYAMFPTVLTSKHKGKPTKEKGAFAFALEKTSGGWKIASWAWATY